MSWGKIYETTDWGYVEENGWGAIYYNEANPSPTPFFELLTEAGDYVITEQNEYIIIE